MYFERRYRRPPSRGHKPAHMSCATCLYTCLYTRAYTHVPIHTCLNTRASYAHISIHLSTHMSCAHALRRCAACAPPPFACGACIHCPAHLRFLHRHTAIHIILDMPSAMPDAEPFPISRHAARHRTTPGRPGCTIAMPRSNFSSCGCVLHSLSTCPSTYVYRMSIEHESSTPELQDAKQPCGPCCKTILLRPTLRGPTLLGANTT